MGEYVEMNECVLTLENIVQCFHAAGFKAILEEPETGCAYIHSSSSGLTFLFIISTEVGVPFRGQFLCFPGQKVTLELANKVNKDGMIVSVSVDDDGEATIYWDVIIHHTSRQQLISSIETWDKWFGDAVMQLKMGQ